MDIISDVLKQSKIITDRNPIKGSYIKLTDEMEEILPHIEIEFFVEDNVINIESIEIIRLIEGSFPINHLQILKDSILNDFNCSELEDQWYQMNLLYTRDSEKGDYYRIVPYSWSGLLYKKIYE